MCERERDTVYLQEKIQQIKITLSLFFFSCTCICRHLHLLSRSLLRIFIVVVTAWRHLGGRSSDRGAVSGVRVREGLIKTEKVITSSQLTNTDTWKKNRLNVADLNMKCKWRQKSKISQMYSRRRISTFMLNTLQPWIEIGRLIFLTVFQFLLSVHFQDRHSCCVCCRWLGNVSSQIRSDYSVRQEAAFLMLHWAGSQRRITSTLFLYYFDKMCHGDKKTKTPWPLGPIVPVRERSVHMKKW